MAKDPQNSYKISTPLLNYIPQTALDAVCGAAALVDADQNLNVVSRNWNEFMARSGRGDLSKNSVLGCSLLQFFRDEQQKQVFRNLLESMANDELGTHNQVVDLGQKDAPFYVQFHVHPLWNEGLLIGYLLHCIDTTKEHANRLTLIDHDRQLLKLREMKETYESELIAAKDLIGSVAKEQAENEKSLQQLQAKTSRKEKALKAAIKQAEHAASSIASKDGELETLRKVREDHQKELTETCEKLELSVAELSDSKEDRNSLTEQLSEVNEEKNTLSEKLESLSSLDDTTETMLKEAQKLQSTLENKLSATDEEKQTLQNELEQQKIQISELKEASNVLEASLASATQQTTEQKSNCDSELQLLEKDRDQLHCTLNSIESPICWINLAGQIQLSNQAFCDFFELDIQNLVETPLNDLFHEEDADRLESLIEDPYSSDSLLLQLANGKEELSILFIPQFEDGQFIGCIGSCEHVSASNSDSPSDMDESISSIDGVRSLSADLADSFGDLLTAVVGHASLAAAEADDESPTLTDIRAIEESAGEAANLVRKLHALCGNYRHNFETDLKAAIMSFTNRCYESENEESLIQHDLTEDSVRVPVDNSSIDVILRGIAAQTDMTAAPDAKPLWQLTSDESFAKLSISYQGSLFVPNGWFDHQIPSRNEQGYDLYFAREAARAFGGRLEILDLNSAMELVLWLPLAEVKVIV